MFTQRTSRHCLPRTRDAVDPVPGLVEVTAACDMLTHSQMTRAVLSVHHSDRDAELIALGQEAARQSGVSLEVESRGEALVLRLSRNTSADSPRSYRPWVRLRER